MNANDKASELRTKLFNLVNEFKALQGQIHESGKDEIAWNAADQIDTAACALAKVHADLGDLFTDAARDEKDQAFAIPLS